MAMWRVCLEGLQHRTQGLGVKQVCRKYTSLALTDARTTASCLKQNTCICLSDNNIHYTSIRSYLGRQVDAYAVLEYIPYLKCAVSQQKRHLVRYMRNPVPFKLARKLYDRIFHAVSTTAVTSVNNSISVNQIWSDDTPSGNQVFSQETLRELPNNKFIAKFRQTVRAGSKDNVHMIKLFQQEACVKVAKADNKLTPASLLWLAECVFYSQDTWSDAKFFNILFDEVLTEFDNAGYKPQEIAQLMFFAYYLGDAPELMLHKVEQVFSERIDKFTFKDMNSICLGFFRTNKRFTNMDLLNSISVKLQQAIQDCSYGHPDFIINVLKSLRHSGFSKESFYKQIGTDLQTTGLKQFDQLNQLMHLGTAFSAFRYYHKEFLTMLAQRAKYLLLEKKQHQKLRSKDVGRLVWVFGTFQYKDPYLMELLMETFQVCLLREQTKSHPESLSEICMGLAYTGIYSESLLNQHFSTSAVRFLRDHPFLEKISQMWFLHHSIQIEKPGYRGNMLTQDFIATLPSAVHGNLEKELRLRQGLASLASTMSELLGDDHVICHFSLPHFHTADVELWLDSKNALVTKKEMQERLKSVRSKGRILPFPDDSYKRFVIGIVGWNQSAINCEMLLGNYQSKVRQLELLGYTVTVIMPIEAQQIDAMAKEERKMYITNRILKLFGIAHAFSAMEETESTTASEINKNV